MQTYIYPRQGPANSKPSVKRCMSDGQCHQFSLGPNYWVSFILHDNPLRGAVITPFTRWEN